MKRFPGFPAGKTRFTPIPDLFFTELLQTVDHLAELKLTLFMFWFLNRQRGYPRYMTYAELQGESAVMDSLRQGPADAETQRARRETPALLDAVDRAVARGTLLRLTISDETGDADYVFLNTPQGRKAVEEVKAGTLVLETTGYVREARADQAQTSVFKLYEQNIGLLQPILAEELLEAQDAYPYEWIVDAFKVAAEQNARNWRYIRSVLERWAREGRDNDGDSRSGARKSSRSRRRYRDW